MKTHLRLLLVCVLFAISTVSNCVADTPRPDKPNVVLILADDLGWQDVACYDVDAKCPFDTPHIDHLAKRGLRFTQGYSPAPTCAPTRAAILAGKHPARLQKTHVVGGAPPSPYHANSRLISPWYSGRMKLGEVTIAEALKSNGYTTGHVGKWHVAINHNAFPQPADQGFDFSRADLGVSRRMKPHRLTGFATRSKDDPYRLDKDGFPRDQVTEDALAFLRQSKGKPFFLYYAAWLVHTPIHSRSEALLRKYCQRMNVPYPKKPTGWDLAGQRNPYYGAMVESLDHYIGMLIRFLRDTDDPRWPGHKLIENTFVIVTSDNGGMERVPGEIITDNAPLDKGKINAREGGVRVPLIIRGPGIAEGATSHAMVNGIDFYPTILGWTKSPKPKGHHLDGADLGPYLQSNLSDPSLIKEPSGHPRDTMVWHFPHSSMQSTIRQGGYKLIREWNRYLLPNAGGLELYRLHDGDKRIDIEEARNLAASMPGKAKAMNALLESRLREMKASQPYLNPTSKAALPRKDKAPTVEKHSRRGDTVWAQYQEHGAKVVRADLIYTTNGGERYEEWFRMPARLIDGRRAQAALPKGTTHYVFNLIDENHYLVSYPTMKLESDRSEKYSKRALKMSSK